MLLKGDFELGLSLLDADDPAHRELQTQLAAGQRERDARQQRLKNAKRIAGGLAAAMALVVTTALVLINREKNRALVAEVEAQQQRDIAVKAEGEAKEQRDLAVEAEGRAKQSEQAARKSAEAEKVAAEQARKSAEAEKVAAEQARLAETQARDAESQARSAEAQARRDRDLADQAKAREEYEAYVARIGLIAAKVEENAFDRAQTLLDECKPTFRNWEWGRLKYLSSQKRARFRLGRAGGCRGIVSGREAIRGRQWDGRVRIWNLGSGGLERQFPYGGTYVHAVAVSPDGQLDRGRWERFAVVRQDFQRPDGRSGPLAFRA